jgi:hypothetical protein
MSEAVDGIPDVWCSNCAAVQPTRAVLAAERLVARPLTVDEAGLQGRADQMLDVIAADQD